MFVNGLFVFQQERAILENLQELRKPGPDFKTLSLLAIEEKLEQIVRAKGEAGLNALRDQAKLVPEETGMAREFGKLNKLISALLTTKPSNLLRSLVATANFPKLCFL